MPEDIALSKYKGIHLNENANSFSQILISIKFNTDVLRSARGLNDKGFN